MAGRGYGKTRMGAEMVRYWVEHEGVKKIAIVARTAADIRDYCIEGISGILAVSDPSFYPIYEPSKRRLTWPNGATATTYSSEEPNQIRGLNSQRTWADEVANWDNPEQAWHQIRLATRIPGKYPPRIIATTTPQPIPLIRQLIKHKRVVVTSGSTYENIANLDENFIVEMKDIYEGTRLGKQELYGQLLGDTPGALWTDEIIDLYRIRDFPNIHFKHNDFKRVVVAVDPAATSTEESSETGIIVAATDSRDHGYILEDLSVRARPMEWARIVLDAFDRHSADRVVAEVNQGGEMVEHTLRQAAGGSFPYTAVRASKGKRTRAEPISTMYEKGKVHHIGVFETLEEQMISWVPGDPSPDRLDAMVWALTSIMPLQGHIPARARVKNMFGSQKAYPVQP